MNHYTMLIVPSPDFETMASWLIKVLVDKEDGWWVEMPSESVEEALFHGLAAIPHEVSQKYLLGQAFDRMGVCPAIVSLDNLDGLIQRCYDSFGDAPVPAMMTVIEIEPQLYDLYYNHEMTFNSVKVNSEPMTVEQIEKWISESRAARLLQNQGE